MSDKIEPALTPEEWKDFAARAETTDVQVGWACAEVFSTLGEVEPHGLAALCLHGQEFGFTWKDAQRVRGTAEMFRISLKGSEPGSREEGEDKEGLEFWTHLAAR